MLKKNISKEYILSLALFITSVNFILWFFEKFIFGDRVFFWDLPPIYCASQLFSNNLSPYGFFPDNPLADCVHNISNLNEGFVYVYSIHLLKFFNLFPELNFLIFKNIWFFIIFLITIFFVYVSKEIFFKKKNFFFYIVILFVLLFSFGGNISNALITGNVSIISFFFISIGLLFLNKKKIYIFYLFIILASLIKPHYFIYITIPILTNGISELKRTIFFLLIGISIYFYDFIINKDLFLNFIDSALTVRKSLWFNSFGDGFGLSSMFDRLPSKLLAFINIKITPGPGLFSYLSWFITSTSLFIIAYFLTKIEKGANSSINNIAVAIVVTTTCLPRMQQYDLFIVIPALFYLGYNMMKSKEKYNGYIGFIFLLTMFIMQDIRTPIFLMLTMIFILFTKKIIFSNKENLMNF
tara:strand:+ start:9132 stop:10364 length:1233 start_codon:yes stop_codon:yes gene_type:complete